MSAAQVEFLTPNLPSRLRAGDPEALRTVVTEYLAQILRAARGAGLDPETAEEVTQRTFTTFLETTSRFEGRSSVRTWLFGILYRKIQEHRREQARDERHLEIDEEFESRFSEAGRWIRPPRTADAEMSDKEVRQQISSCLASAPTRQRAAFVLREIEGFSTPEICEILGINRNHLGVALHRVRNRLRSCLETQGLRPADLGGETSSTGKHGVKPPGRAGASKQLEI